MARSAFFLVCVMIGFLGLVAQAGMVKHTFHVGNLTVRPLCKNTVITAVNEIFPGPTIEAHEGDTVVVQVINESPYNITIHWHGIFQLMTQWADGPSYITQCPIRPGNNYTYKFNIVEQEGTLWWHAHSSVLRATVYGALIILPRGGTKYYPFPTPYREITILLGEWWDANVVDLQTLANLENGTFATSDAYTINGSPGHLNRCSENHTYNLLVEQGKTYLLRIINAALNNHLFYEIAGHSLTVVAVDASYTTPYPTDTITIAPGQTVDALLLADAAPGRYYMAARTYMSTIPEKPSFPTNTAVATLIYTFFPTTSASPPPLLPTLPAFNDTPTAHRFYSNLTALLRTGVRTVPLHVDHSMLVTIGFGFALCGADQTLCRGLTYLTSMNNVSFIFPTTMSLLEAQFLGINEVYTSDFPDLPPAFFDFTDAGVNRGPPFLLFPEKGTKVKRVKYNSTVEMVLQNTAVLAIENHPMHLHGYNFHVLAQGFGNYNESEAVKKYNLVNPQVRNTIAVPAGGWAVIRFTANNPGIWAMHCHFDAHLSLGMVMAFEVENGPTPSTMLLPPPPDFPSC